MTDAADASAGTADIVPSYIWINNDCGIEEFSETAVLAPALSQGLVLLCAEDSGEPDRAQPRDTATDDEELLPELDGILKFPGRKRRK